uniref:Uncharacterized protein n=1 Tax=Avena sativa TaxID=4498 RepID=A0ACD5YN40_AVESA
MHSSTSPAATTATGRLMTARIAASTPLLRPSITRHASRWRKLFFLGGSTTSVTTTSNAKIHGQKLNTLITQEAVNRSSTANKETISLKYSLSRETKWDSTASIKFGVTTTVEAGIPGILSGSVQLSTEFTFSHGWGQAVTRTEEHSTDYEVTVSPNTKVDLRMLATQATCEVPFSYSQEDVLWSGQKVVYKFNDGIYRGVSNYGFKIDVSEKKL